jgi:hypothetical protein
MYRIIRRVFCAVSICAPVLVVSPAERSSAAPAQVGGAMVCTPSVTGDSSVPNSGQYEHDCRMAMALCAAFGIVGAYDANHGGNNGAFGKCLRKAVADDEREYEAWVKGGRVPVKPDPQAAAEEKKEMEVIQQQQQEQLAQERAVCTAGKTVRVKVRTSVWRSHGIGMMERLTGHIMPGQLAQANGVDSTGNQCIVAVESGGEEVTGTVPLYGIEAVN